MKIASSDIQLQSRHAAVEQYTRRESLRVWIGDGRPDAGPAERRGEDRLTLSSEARRAHAAEAAAPEQGQDAAPDTLGDFKLQVLKLLLEKLTGREIEVLSEKDLRPAEANAAAPATAASDQARNAPPRAGFGVEYDYYESRYEHESTTFSAQGVVRTADGRDIEFSVELSMSRAFMEEHAVSLRAGDAVVKDPLVVNFNGTAAQLTETQFRFDLDADGAEDLISFVAPGSGFLALDRNGDGVINDGGELFGPASGDGFAELAAYDQDGNRWIDESDAIYADLRVWSKDAEGADVLAGLKEGGIGAIYLESIATPFDLKTGANELEGQIKASGLYLNEDGTAGTVQQLDLVV